MTKNENEQWHAIDYKEVVNTFESSNNSYYRKVSIEALNDLAFLFERNGHFEQALLVASYLYEINPAKYSVIICSLNNIAGTSI